MIYDSQEDFEKYLEDWAITRQPDLCKELPSYLQPSWRQPRPTSFCRFKNRWLSSWLALKMLLFPHPLTQEEWDSVLTLKVQGLLSRDQLRMIYQRHRVLERRRQFWCNFRRRPLKATWLWLQSKINSRRWGLK